MPAIAFPARCAVAVVCGDKLISQVYPASVPVEVFIDDALELLDDDLKHQGGTGLDPLLEYEFQRANGTRLDATRTLDDLGIVDGATLFLVPAADGDSFEPQIESLSTCLAQTGRRLFPTVTARSAVRTATGIVAVATLTSLGLACILRWQTDATLIAVAPLLLGLMLLTGALAVARWFPGHRELLDGFAWLAMPQIAVGIAIAAPGTPGPAHLFIAFLAAAVFAMAFTSLTWRRVAFGSAVIALSCLGVGISGTDAYSGLSAQQLGVLGLLFVLILLTAGPNVALLAARARPPHFGSITGRDVFRRSDGMPVDAVLPVVDGAEDTAADRTPAAAVVVETAKRTNGVLRGICAACGIALPLAGWAVLNPGAPRSGAAIALVIMFIVVFISRARAFSDRRQATALVYGAALTVCVVVARHSTHTSADPLANLLLSTAALTMFAAAGLAAALMVPSTRFTPLVRMLTEWTELAAIVVALPLAAWISGLFTWVRMR